MTSECSPIIRVCRKRSADPHSALVVQLKRQKADPLLFSLFKTCDNREPEFSEKSASKKVIDFSSISEAPSNEIEVDNPLAFANQSINEVGGPEPQVRNDEQIITINGRPMVTTRTSENDFVFDFYKISRGHISEDVDEITDLDMRFATKEEEDLLCLDDNSESENGCLDDDEDSNEEGNWKNDYPDEESDDELENGEEESAFSFNNMRLQMQRFGFNNEEYDGHDVDEDYEDMLHNYDVDHDVDDDDDEDEDDFDGF